MKKFEPKYVTVIATQKLVVQDTPSDEEGMITIRYQADGHTERVHESEVTRLRKYIKGRLMDVYYCGKFVQGEHSHWMSTPEEKGIVWNCYSPIGFEASAWVRFEALGYRPRMVYDPGSHLRRTLDDHIN